MCTVVTKIKILQIRPPFYTCPYISLGFPIRESLFVQTASIMWTCCGERDDDDDDGRLRYSVNGSGNEKQKSVDLNRITSMIA